MPEFMIPAMVTVVADNRYEAEKIIIATFPAVEDQQPVLNELGAEITVGWLREDEIDEIDAVVCTCPKEILSRGGFTSSCRFHRSGA